MMLVGSVWVALGESETAIIISRLVDGLMSYACRYDPELLERQRFAVAQAVRSRKHRRFSFAHFFAM
jgi:hypothetical protein